MTKEQPVSWEEVKIDNGTVDRTVSHVYKSDFSGNRGRDMCLEMFGEENEECISYNKSP